MSEWDRQATPGGVEGPQWVSAAEAADVAGVTPGTVRYWARNGLIVSEVVEGPAGERTLVRLDEVVQHARQEEGPRRPGAPAPGPAGEVVTELPARTSELAPILKSIPEIMAQLTSATDRAARAETKVEFLSAQLADMRRRLEEAEQAGGTGRGEPVTLPEAWQTSAVDDSAAVVAEETPAAAESTAAEELAGIAGWPAPPPDALRDVPAEAVEPGPDTIDWGTSSPSSAPAPSSEREGAREVEDLPTPAAASEGASLDDIWNRPGAPPAPRTPEPEPEPDRSGVDWHEPSGTATSEPSAAPRAANAPVPGDDFYGPRRRRWFRRRG